MRYRSAHLDAIGYELPAEVVDSDELESRLESVYRRLGLALGQLEPLTGIEERRFWEPGFSMARGAALAARSALERSAVKASEVGALAYAGVCRDLHEPATACRVAAELDKLGHLLPSAAMIYDISNACLGVLSAVVDMANRVELGQIKAGMVVTCESARDIVETTVARLKGEGDADNFRLSIATLTGGSAAAAVLVTDGSFETSTHRLLGGVAESEPQHHELCRWGIEETRYPGESEALPASGAMSAALDRIPLYRQIMETDAPKVLEHGLEIARRTWQRFLPEIGWRGDSIDRTVCHQVGARHRQAVLEALDMPEDRDFAAYAFLGNTGTAAVPVALALAEERGFLESGHRVGLLGIGSGLNCLMLGVEW